MDQFEPVNALITKYKQKKKSSISHNTLIYMEK